MAQPYVGEIRMFAGNFAPTGWAFCEGQLLPISQNTALFSLLGTTYGGNLLATLNNWINNKRVIISMSNRVRAPSRSASTKRRPADVADLVRRWVGFSAGRQIVAGMAAYKPEVLREAVRCAIDKHGKRRGAVKPARERKPAEREARPVASKREPIPAAVRRAVWERDRGRCTYVSAEGQRCESRWQLQYDHLEPAALGGPSTVDGLRLRCRGHNLLHAEESFGREHMARFRRGGRPASRTGRSTIAGESAL